jgi:hypothetical protein
MFVELSSFAKLLHRFLSLDTRSICSLSTVEPAHAILGNDLLPTTIFFVKVYATVPHGTCKWAPFGSLPYPLCAQRDLECS